MDVIDYDKLALRIVPVGEPLPCKRDLRASLSRLIREHVEANAAEANAAERERLRKVADELREQRSRLELDRKDAEQKKREAFDYLHQDRLAVQQMRRELEDLVQSAAHYVAWLDGDGEATIGDAGDRCKRLIAAAKKVTQRMVKQ